MLKMEMEYSSIAESEKFPLCESNAIESFDQYYRFKRHINYLIAALVGALLLCISLIIYIFTHPINDLTCAVQVSSYSPLISAVEYEEHNFVNSFGHRTKYRGPPTNHLEREWERLWNLPYEEFPKFNKSANDMFMEVKGGLAVNLEVFHQLHCLNLIRQYSWKDYYDLHPDLVQKPSDIDLDTEEGLRVHVDHCIDTLRLALMCHADVTPFLIQVENATDKGVADFNNHHKCRKFDKIVDEFDARFASVRFPYIDVAAKQYEDLIVD